MHAFEFSLEKVCVLLGQRRKRALISLVQVQSGQHVPACRVGVRFSSLYTLFKTHLIYVPRCSCGFLKLSLDKRVVVPRAKARRNCTVSTQTPLQDVFFHWGE